MRDGSPDTSRTASVSAALRRLILPSAIPTAVSLAIHAGLAAVLLTVGVRMTIAPPPPPTGAGLAEISLLTPSASPAAGVSSTADQLAERLASARAIGSGIAAPQVHVDAELAVEPVELEPAPTLERTLPGTGIASVPVEAPGDGARFAGLEAERGLRIAYVVDASGAMAATMPYVTQQVAESIAALGSDQRFRVYIYRAAPGKGATETFARGWADASADRKIAATRWLRQVIPAGRSAPLPGLRTALATKPDVLFLLARSIERSGPDAAWGIGTQATLAELDRLNPMVPELGRRRTVIKAVHFIDDDPTGLMQAIGEIHGDGQASYTVLRPQEEGP